MLIVCVCVYVCMYVFVGAHVLVRMRAHTFIF
jgi:hypothetical protein